MLPVAAPFSLTWRPALKWAGLLPGIALGGFFDGIVLHQILQRCHLLSAIEGQPRLDLRMQPVMGGVFHGLMYVVLAAGLMLLIKARHDFALSKADGDLFAGTLISFGLWNVLDGGAGWPRCRLAAAMTRWSSFGPSCHRPDQWQGGVDRRHRLGVSGQTGHASK